MKKLFEFLQTHAVPLCLYFGITPYLPPYLQQKLGFELATYATWALLATSLILFLLCFWWLMATWVVMKPANMMAMTFASVLGLMISATALLAMYGFGTELYYLWRGTPANLLQAAMVVALLCQVFGINPFAKSSD